ncbi:MAG: D-aminoacylase [Planctomycetes bacterium]|nr:D-aminoacylase [Planctomycetota bacterium]
MSRNVSRRRFLVESSRAAVGLALIPRMQIAPTFDVVIRGGVILDGTGGPAWQADVGVRGDTIADVGAIPKEAARRVIDATGLHVCPGFIDIHTHSDRSVLSCPTADSRVRQGVTTEVTGNCGSSAAPRFGLELTNGSKDADDDASVKADWTDVASYAERLEKARISVNHAILVGQGTLRRSVVGLADRPLTPDETKQLLRAVEEAMDQGAFGLSTGLEYTPGRWTPTDEIVEMARIVARSGGLYASHVRNEEATLLEAIHEALEIGRRSGVRVQVSHVKAAGRRNWPKQRPALGLIEAARAAGVDVRGDVYPYTAYATGLSIFLDDATLEGGADHYVKRLKDPENRARIRALVIARVASDPGDYDLVVISDVKTERNQGVVGKNLAEIAAAWKIEPVDALLRLLEEEEGSVSFIGHAMSPENVDTVLAHPLVMIGSDGSSRAPKGGAADKGSHPRSYGTFARVLARYVRERHVLDLSTAVKKMTSLPADQLGLADRGRIARGHKADLVVFDAEMVKDEATFDDPCRFASGISHVLVNGVSVVENGAHTGARPGRALRRPT